MRKRMLVILFIILATMLLLAVAAGAAEAKKPANYLSFRFGQFAPMGDLDDEGYEPGGHGQLIFGHYFTSFFALEGGALISHFHGSDEPPYSSIYIDRPSTLGGWVLTPKLVYPTGRFSLYAGAGIGYYHADFEFYLQGPPGGYYELKDNLWGYHVLAGADYDITRSWYLGLEFKYLSVPDFKDAFDIEGRTISLNIGLRF